MRKKLLSVIIVIVIAGILYSVFDNRYAMVKVFDKTTKNYIYEPQITMFPEITLEGQPGTGAAGPYLYKPIIPLLVTVNVSAAGYKSEKKIILLMKGRESVVYLTRD
ncbi:MAG TPA: hypothetical protein VEG39_08395 [Clostridia bacterium]|nr:hypothetical protein [Clostridia bacterium]